MIQKAPRRSWQNTEWSVGRLDIQKGEPVKLAIAEAKDIDIRILPGQTDHTQRLAMHKWQTNTFSTGRNVCWNIIFQLVVFIPFEKY